MHDRITSSLCRFLALSALAACLLAAPVGAQIETLPQSDKLVFTPEEKLQIEKYAADRLDAMEHGMAPERERARKDLLTPLRRPGVSVAFRQILRAAVIDRLTALADSPDEEVAINAIVLLGGIADDASRQVLQQHTDDEGYSVRYAAAAALTSTFRAVDAFAPALDPARVSQAVVHLTERLAVEPDARVADAITRALLEAATITREGFAAPATEALTSVAAGVGQRLRHADASARPLALLTCVRVANNLAARLSAPGNLPTETTREVATFAGEMLAYLAYHAKKGDLPAAGSRGLELDLANLAERLLVLSHAKLGKTISPPGVAAMLESGSDMAFYDKARAAVVALGGDSGILPPEPMQRIHDALDGE